MNCDFCQAHEASWHYKAKEFELPRWRGESIGVSQKPWAACQRCHVLIDTGHWDTLRRRCLLSFVQRYGLIEQADVKDQLDVMMRTLHATFRAHRIGAATMIVQIK